MKKLIFILLCFSILTFGSSARIIEVAPAGAWGVLGISGGGAVAGGCSTTIADAFGADTITSGVWVVNAGTWQVTGGVMQQDDDDNAGMISYENEETCTVDQWLQYEVAQYPSTSYMGGAFRFDGNTSNVSYAFRFTDGDNKWEMRDCINATCNTTGVSADGLTSPIATDTIGAAVFGTTTSTVMLIWHNPSSTSAWDSTVGAGSNWGNCDYSFYGSAALAQSCDVSDHSIGVPGNGWADVGKYTGLYSGGFANAHMQWDNFSAGEK